MKSGSLHRLLPFGLIMALLAGVVACSRTPQADVRLMDSAEAMMESAPDSALALIERVDSAAVRGRADRARYALLRSMALDRNIIELTDFSILQPAIDYYPKHGTPDQRLKTRYYEGRIHMNRGDDDAAMTAFLEAAEDFTLVRDSLPLARLHRALGVMFDKQYKLDRVVPQLARSAEIYGKCNRKADEFFCFRYILNTAVLKNDTTLAERMLIVCDSIAGLHPDDEQYDFTSDRLMAYMVFRNPSELGVLIDSLRNVTIRNDVAMLNLALCLTRVGKTSESLEVIDCVDPREIPDSLKYISIKSEILENAGKDGEALDEYRKFVHGFEAEQNRLLRSRLLFSEERYALQLDSLRKIIRRNRIIGVCMSVAAILIVLSAILYYRVRISRIKRLKAEDERREIARRLAMEKENHRLETERRELMAQNYDAQISNLEYEIENLRAILSSEADNKSEVNRMIADRIEKLNSVIAMAITRYDGHGKPFRDWLEEIKKDKIRFLDETIMAFSISHPHFVRYLEEHGLTDDEVRFVCVYAIGLNGKEAGIYLGQKSHYVIGTEIRRKLGIDKHTNMATFIRRLLRNPDQP